MKASEPKMNSVFFHESSIVDVPLDEENYMETRVFQEDLDGISFEVNDRKPNLIGKFLQKSREKVSGFRDQTKWLRPAILVACVIGYIIYFAFAMSKQYGKYPFPFPNGNYILFILTMIVLIFILWSIIVPRLNRRYNMDIKIKKYIGAHPNRFKWTLVSIYSLWALVTLTMAILILVDSKQASNLQSVLGIVLLPLLTYLTSLRPSMARIRIVFAGMALQFWMGLFVLRTKFGFDLVQWIAGRVTLFLDFSIHGAEFVYGDIFAIRSFILPVTSIIIFLSSIVSVLYYWGAMQWIILKLAYLITMVVGVSVVEAVGAAANIFLGQTEAPLLIKPYLEYVTPSEFHALMTAGFASVSGSVLGGYISVGVDATHLITACFMVAPGALAMANLSYPEDLKSKATSDMIKEFKVDSSVANIFEAALQGAVSALFLCGAILASLIATTSILYLLDSLVMWFFSMVNQDHVSFQVIIGYLFFPFAFIIGIHPRDCLVAGRLFGLKTFLNEFIAFEQLVDIQNLRNDLISNNTFSAYYCGQTHLPSKTLMLWNQKSIVVMTYALCGFANFASVGIQIGGLTALAPKRKKTISVYVLRAMLTGIVANLLNASLSGLLYKPTGTDVIDCSMFPNTTEFTF